MTIEREEPGVWAATCDTCGDRKVLDLDGNDPTEDAEAELVDAGWTARPPEVVKFKSDYERSPLRVEYREHDCPDCA